MADHSASDTGRRRVSITQVARQAGVSYQTVSRVINHSPNVSPATRARVEKAITALDYHPLNFARALVTSQSRTIGFVAGGVSYYGPISTIGALEARARDHGLAVSVAVYNERRDGRSQFDSIISAFSAQGVDALVYLTPTTQLLRAALAVRSQQPAVFLTSASQPARQAAAGADPARRRFVGIDQAAGEGQILDLLARLGRKRLLLLAGPQEWADASVRLEALEAGAIRRGMRYRVMITGSWQSKAAEEAVASAFVGRTMPEGQADVPDAVVAANDLQALGALRALARLGIRVPQEVSVTGFDDMPGADAVMPSLTTVRPDFQALGGLAMTQVLAMLAPGEATNGSDGTDGTDDDGTVGSDRTAGDDGTNPSSSRSSSAASPSFSRVVDGIRLLCPRLVVRESTAPVADR